MLWINICFVSTQMHWLSPLSPLGSSGMSPSTWPCLGLSHGSLLEPFLQVKIHKTAFNETGDTVWYLQNSISSLSRSLSSQQCHPYTCLSCSFLIIIKRCICYHLQSKWTGPLGERSGKADYVNQNGDWFILMRVTSFQNTAHLNDIRVKIHQSLSYSISYRGTWKWNK